MARGVLSMSGEEIWTVWIVLNCLLTNFEISSHACRSGEWLCGARPGAVYRISSQAYLPSILDPSPRY